MDVELQNLVGKKKSPFGFTKRQKSRESCPTGQMPILLPCHDSNEQIRIKSSQIIVTKMGLRPKFFTIFLRILHIQNANGNLCFKNVLSKKSLLELNLNKYSSYILKIISFDFFLPTFRQIKIWKCLACHILSKKTR